MSQDDPYREWDAAYVLGSLPPGERVEYEQHLATCDDCARDVTELTGMRGVLSTVSADRAMTLVEPDLSRPGAPPAVHLLVAADADPGQSPRDERLAGQSMGGATGAIRAEGMPRALLPRVMELATADRARRRRRRGAILAAVVATAACVALAVTLVLPRFLSDASRSPAIVLAQTVSGPITAEAQLIEEPWGTRIEVTCWYSTYGSPPPGVTLGAALPYDLYITDTDGVTTKQASWAASPGMVATPSATTQLLVDQIASIDIRVGGSDLVLLDAQL